MIRLLTILFTTWSVMAQTVIVDPYRFGASPGNNLLTGLQAYYKADEASGNLLDATANARHMTQFGTIESLADGKIVTTRHHDSAENDDYFAVASAAWNTFGTGDFTITYWFNPNAFAVGTVQDQYHIAKTDAVSGSAWAIGVDRGAYAFDFALVFYRSTDGGFGTFTELLNIELPQTLDANDGWWFAAITRSGNNFTLYIAKETETTLTLTDTATEALTIFDNSTVPLTVGSYLSGGTPQTSQDTEGGLDEIGIWSRALNTCELLKVFNAGAARAHSTFDSNPCS